MPQLPTLRIGEDVVFTIAVRDLFATPVDAIVNPTNSGLSHGGGLAEIISRMAGDALDNECDAYIEREGMLETCAAVMTGAGQLNFKAVIHAVGPRIGNGGELFLLEQTIRNVLAVAEQACEAAEQGDDCPSIESVAFPAISTGRFGIPKSLCAQAFANVMKEYMQAEQPHKFKIKNVWLCVGIDDFELFAQHFASEKRHSDQNSDDEEAAEFQLDDEELSGTDDGEIDGWFN